MKLIESYNRKSRKQYLFCVILVGEPEFVAYVSHWILKVDRNICQSCQKAVLRLEAIILTLLILNFSWISIFAFASLSWCALFLNIDKIKKNE